MHYINKLTEKIKYDLSIYYNTFPTPVYINLCNYLKSYSIKTESHTNFGVYRLNCGSCKQIFMGSITISFEILQEFNEHKTNLMVSVTETVHHYSTFSTT